MANPRKSLTNQAAFIILSNVKCVDGDSANLPAYRERVYGVSPCCEDAPHRWFARHSRAPREISGGVRPALEVKSGIVNGCAIWVVPRNLRPISGWGFFIFHQQKGKNE